MMDDPPSPDNPQLPGLRLWRPWLSVWLVSAALFSVAAFAAGVVIGVFLIGSGGSSGGTGSPNDAIACFYFWQFEADPGNPALVQDALSHNPGTDSGSHYLYEWLSTLYQQVSSQQTLENLQADSKDGTAVAIGSICQQEGFNSPKI